MTVKNFFKALGAGLDQNISHELKYALVVVFSTVVVALITLANTCSFAPSILAGVCTGVVSIIMLAIYERCKIAVDYAEEHNVDMNTAWTKTSKKNDEPERVW